MEETTRASSYQVAEHRPVRYEGLLNEAVDLAHDRPLWRLMALRSPRGRARKQRKTRMLAINVLIPKGTVAISIAAITIPERATNRRRGY